MRATALVITTAALITTNAAAQSGCEGLSGLAGRYAPAGRPAASVVYADIRRGTLVLRPIDWQGGAPFGVEGRDRFSMIGHEDRFHATFTRDARGCGERLATTGYGYDEELVRVPDHEELAIEHAYRGGGGGRALVAALPLDSLADVARGLLRWPSLGGPAESLLRSGIERHPQAPGLLAMLGDALMLQGRHAEAAVEFRRALEIDEGHGWAGAALRMLGEPDAPAVPDGWRLPFPAAELFAPPTPREVARVRRRWADRDLSPRKVALVRRERITVGGAPAEARVYRHDVHGATHYGVILVPDGARGAPILAEARGVSPRFPPLDVPSSLTGPRVLGEEAKRTIIVSPAYRGEGLVLLGDTLWAGGDRSDAWDGATDDFLAFLAVAKRVTPEADTSRVCAFGRSRGGTVALLASIREPSLACTVAWAAPTEWLRLMGTWGWTQRQLVEEGLRQRSPPGRVGGQFIDYFLSRALAGTRGLADTRLHLVASSPLYFADRTGTAQVHWAGEDSAVPVINGREFVRAAGPRGARCLEVHFHDDAGHDQDRVEAPWASRRYLLAHLFEAEPPPPRPCGPRPG